jgi:hypothetical protein
MGPSKRDHLPMSGRWLSTGSCPLAVTLESAQDLARAVDLDLRKYLDLDVWFQIMSWPLTFIDLEGDGPRSFAEVWALIEETPKDATPTANIRRLTGRLQMRFPEPIAWGFTPRGRLLGASFSYSSNLDTDLLLAERDAAHAAMFDEDNDMIFPPSTIDWPWVEADWVVGSTFPEPEPDLSPRLTATQPGDRVVHDVFGEGTVVSTVGSGPETQAKIAFDTADTKTFVLRYAHLRLL